MSTETTNVKEAIEKEAEPINHKPVQKDPPRVVREAEHKLKEMSRKAKERRNAQTTVRQPRGLSEINYFWLVIGGLGALGVGYLIFGNKEPEPKRPRYSSRAGYRFVPKPKTPEKATNHSEPDIQKEEKPACPAFELNCF